MTVSSRGRRRLLPPVLEDEQAMAGLLARHTRAGCEAGPECHSRLALEAARQAVRWPIETQRLWPVLWVYRFCQPGLS